MECAVYRCSNKEEMYLYVSDKGDDEASLKNLPEDLLLLTGELIKVINLDLASKRKLARVSVDDVIAAIKEKGFFLQPPPNEVLRKDNSMLNDPSDSF